MIWTHDILDGDDVRLEPLTEAHIDQLWSVAKHPEIWRYMPFLAGSRREFETHVRSLIEQCKQGTSLPFVTIYKPQQKVVGSTSYLALNEPNRRLEIGATWITPELQRSAVNTEAKLLQLDYAFDQLGCNRVEFKTDSQNQRSRDALARIGATEEGTFRNHMVLPDGRLRHSVWFSIIKSEWPRVRAGLVAKLAGASS